MRVRTVLQLVGVMGLIALGLALGGPARAQEGAGGDPARGAELYAENCLVCHGPGGEGRAGATLNNVFSTIAPDEFLREVISRGVQGSFMPAWSEAYGGPLTEAEVTDLVAYVESWGTTVEPPLPAPRRPPVAIPPVPEVDGDPTAGYTVFQQNCAACHGEQGEGRIGATLTTAFAAISPQTVAVETISRGVSGSLMPPFARAYGGPLTDQEVNDVAAYVLSIQHEARPQPQGEVVGRASAWPLLAALGGILIVIIALGLAVRGGRQDDKPAGDDSGH